MHIADRVGSSACNYPCLTVLVTSSCFQLLLSLLDVTHPGWNVFCQGLASGWFFPLPFSSGRRKGEGSFGKNGSVVSRARLGNCLFEQELEIWQNRGVGHPDARRRSQVINVFFKSLSSCSLAETCQLGRWIFRGLCQHRAQCVPCLFLGPHRTVPSRAGCCLPPVLPQALSRAGFASGCPGCHCRRWVWAGKWGWGTKVKRHLGSKPWRIRLWWHKELEG